MNFTTFDDVTQPDWDVKLFLLFFPIHLCDIFVHSLVSLKRNVNVNSHQSSENLLVFEISLQLFTTEAGFTWQRGAPRNRLFAIAVWICRTLTAALWKREHVSKSLVRLEREIREIGRFGLRIQDRLLPITHSPPLNSTPAMKNVKTYPCVSTKPFTGLHFSI